MPETETGKSVEQTTPGESAALTPTSATRRYPSRISRLVENSDPRIVSRMHQDYYGFEVNDRFVADLVKYTKNPTQTPHLLRSGNPQRVIDTLREVYGLRVTEDYARDLLAYSQQHAKKGDEA